MSSELEVDVIGDALPEERVRDLVALALASAGVEDGHVAVEFVDAERIASLNAEHRGKSGPTDVLSFGVDEDGETYGPRELGDVVICPLSDPPPAALGNARRIRSATPCSSSAPNNAATPTTRASSASASVSSSGRVTR